MSSSQRSSHSAAGHIAYYQRQTQLSTLQSTIEGKLRHWLKENDTHFNLLIDTLNHTPYANSPHFTSLPDDVKNLLVNPKEAFHFIDPSITEDVMKNTILTAMTNALDKHQSSLHPLAKKQSKTTSTTSLITTELNLQTAKMEQKKEKTKELVTTDDSRVDALAVATASSAETNTPPHIVKTRNRKYSGGEIDNPTTYKRKKISPKTETTTITKISTSILTP